MVGLCAFMAATVVSAAGDSGPITPTRTLGLDEGPLVLNHPIDLAWSADGRAYVLNGGDNTVIVFGQDWQYRQTFAGRGEAPGELNNPAMLRVIGAEIWVKVPRGIEVYDLEGQYLELRRLKPTISSFCPYNGAFVGISSAPEGMVVRFDRHGSVLGTFGPRSSTMRDMRELVRGSSRLLLTGSADQITLLDRFDGKALRSRGLESDGQVIDLDLGRGQFANDFQFKTVVSDACVDPAGGYFVIHYPRAGGPGYLYHYTVDWRQERRWRFAEGMRPGTVRVSPRGEICLLEEPGSIVHLCDLPKRR